jgi:hypothetical protein
MGPRHLKKQLIQQYKKCKEKPYSETRKKEQQRAGKKKKVKIRRLSKQPP